MAFRNIPPNGFPAIPDMEDLEGVEKDVSTLKTTTAGLAEDVSELRCGLTNLTNTETVTLTAAEGVTLENVSITKIGRVMIGSFSMTLSADVAIFGEIATISKTVSHKAVFPITNGGFCYSDDVSNKIRTRQGLNAGTYIVQLVAFAQ